MDQFNAWIQQLKQKGYSDEEIGKMFAGSTKLSAADVYLAIENTLTDEEKTQVEAIADDAEASKKIQEFFQKHTGMTIEQVIDKTQDDVFKALAEKLPEKSKTSSAA